MMTDWFPLVNGRLIPFVTFAACTSEPCAACSSVSFTLSPSGFFGVNFVISSSMSASAGVGATTVIVTDFVNFGSFTQVAVMTACPAFTPVTLP